MLAKRDGEKACVDHETVMRRVVDTKENFILIVCGPGKMLMVNCTRFE